MIHVNAVFWNNHQLCVLQVLNVKETNPARKAAKNCLRQKCHDIISECHDIMKIRRQNYIATMDFYVVTLPEKFLKKNVTTFFCSVAALIKENGNKVLSRHSNLCCDIKNLRGKEECCDTTKLCRDRKWQMKETSQVKSSWSQQRFLCCDKHFRE